MHEGLVSIADKGSVITWDFDVMRNDVVFTVYRLKNPLPMGPTGQAGQTLAGQPAGAATGTKDSAAAAEGAAAEEAKSAKKSPPPSSKVSGS